MLATLGLALIAIAWIYQLMQMRGKTKGVNGTFVGLYALGVALLLVSDHNHPFTSSFALNLITFLATLGIWQSLNQKK